MRYGILLFAVIASFAGSFTSGLSGQGRRESHPGCFCRDCAGGKQCCCVRADSAIGRALVLAQCDRAEQRRDAVLSVLHWWMPQLPVIPLPLLEVTGYSPLLTELASQPMDQPDPPPRFL